MKKVLVTFAVAAIMVSCGNNGSANEHGDMHTGDSMPGHDYAAAADDIKAISVQYTTIDPGVSSFMKGMMQDYLQVKNALVNDKAEEAATAAGRMHASMKQFDKSLLTADQKKIYDGVEEDMKEQAEHISENNAIEHKRSHFSMMSEDLYTLVKAFGGGQPVYHDHCPMAKDGQGAMWLSEVKDIRNPYFGDQMMECGSVEEVIQ